jgi:osmotically inducible protein OsmC
LLKYILIDLGKNPPKLRIQLPFKLQISRRKNMATRQATAKWNGTLKEGNGVMKYGAFEGPFTFVSRFEEGEGTNPEELVGAAHAGCYSMFLSALITGENFTPTSIETTASVHLGDDDGPKIISIDLVCEAVVPGLDEGKFAELVQAAKEKCPISRLYAGTEINLSAKLAG